jgi:hypothetical protein
MICAMLLPGKTIKIRRLSLFTFSLFYSTFYAVRQAVMKEKDRRIAQELKKRLSDIVGVLVFKVFGSLSHSG